MFRLSIQRVGSVLQNRLSAQVANNGKFYLIFCYFNTQKLCLQKFRENNAVQYCFGVFNFDLTRKVLKKIRTFTHLCFVEAHLLICEAVNYSEISEKTRENSYVQNNNAP